MVENYTSVSNVYKNVIKSEEDSRLYCGLELTNGMRILLISDIKTDRSAAALSVQIGTMSDPPDILGLAHFCEHMLFLGTEKYPSENEYNKYIKEHGGFCNAYTSEEATCYYFDITPEHLKGALDRFAQFFLSPLFNESSTEKEVNVVDSEYRKNLLQDNFRLGQLDRSTCNPNHDYSKFGTGNIETLWNIPKSKGIKVRDELLKFHEAFYSSNVMGLVVIGKETIEDLIDMVIPLFSNVSNKNIQIPEWKDHPYDSAHLKLKGFAVPVKDIKRLDITFPLPDLSHLYKSRPECYLSHLIGHEGPGSLLSELKHLGWATDLIAGRENEGAKGFSFFMIHIGLTDEGTGHVDDIVRLLFQYLAMLKEEGPQEWIFKEYQKLDAMKFRFADRESPFEYAPHLASRMYKYPIEEVLCGPFFIQTYKPDMIIDLLNMLTPDRLRIAVVAKKFEDICTSVEKWYGTRYTLQIISENILDIWRNVKLHPKFKLPLPNEFIPSNFELMPKENDNMMYPQLIKNTPMSRLWFKQDDEFLLPKAALRFELESPVVYLDPLHYNMSNLFIALIKDSLNEFTYAATLAGLSYSLTNSKRGILLFIEGYNDKQHVLLKKIMDRLTNFKIDEKRFLIFKEELHRSLGNFRLSQPSQLAVYYTSLLLSERHWSVDELLNCIEEITIESIQQMISRLLSKIHIEAFLHGNITQKQAFAIMNMVESTLEKNANTGFLLPSLFFTTREVHLSDAHHYIYEVKYEHDFSSVQAFYQCGVQETRSNVLLELLSQMMSEPCFNYLRTQEQLGYIVSSGIRRSYGTQGIRFLIQSDKLPSFVDGRIEAFIQYFEKYIQEMTSEDFKNHIHSLTSLRLETPKNLLMKTQKFWCEIASRQYHFKRDNTEVEVLKTITKEELYSYFKDLVAYDAPHRKKLSVHVLSSKSTDNKDDLQFSCPSMDQESNDGLIPPPPAFRPPEKVEDVIAFKRSLALYPLVPPCIYIPPVIYGIPERSKL